MRVESAEIAASREVLIAGLDDKQAAGWGTVVGATIAGTAAYGITEADNPAGVAITIIAAVVGGLAGLAAEERRKTRRGAEYILRDEAGKRFAVVQSLGPGEAVYEPGTSVSLIYGSRGYVRVVPDEMPARLDLDQGAPSGAGATSRRKGGEPQVGEAMRPAVLGRTVAKRRTSRDDDPPLRGPQPAVSSAQEETPEWRSQRLRALVLKE